MMWRWLGLFFMPLGLAETFVGMAYDDEGQLLYQEEHQMIGERFKLVSQYLSDNDELPRCTMTSDFAHPYLPDTAFKDTVSGKEFVLKTDDDSVNIDFRSSHFSKLKQNRLPLKTSTVAGQGLHFWIVDHLDRLIDGEKITFDYVVASEGKKLGMIAAAESMENDVIKVTMEPESFFIGLFLGAVELMYSKNGQILEYMGPSNIWFDEDGNPINVHIKYKYLVANKT